MKQDNINCKLYLNQVNFLYSLFHLLIFLFGPEAFYQIRIQVLFPAMHTLEICPALAKQQEISLLTKMKVL